MNEWKNETWEIICASLLTSSPGSCGNVIRAVKFQHLPPTVNARNLQSSIKKKYLLTAKIKKSLILPCDSGIPIACKWRIADDGSCSATRFISKNTKTPYYPAENHPHVWRQILYHSLRSHGLSIPHGRLHEVPWIIEMVELGAYGAIWSLCSLKCLGKWRFFGIVRVDAAVEYCRIIGRRSFSHQSVQPSRDTQVSQVVRHN